jgi:septal ring factor EnvC (AmiA/AmiB activator)
MKRLSAVLLMLFILGLTSQSIGQTSNKEKLKEQYNELLQEIRKTEEVLAETKKNKQATVSELAALQRKIDIRKRLIGNIDDQISGLDNKITETAGVIYSMEKDLDEFKEEYAGMLYYAYVNQDQYDKVSFIFSSRNFAEAIRRFQYMKEYTSFRKEQIEMIELTKDALSFKIGELELSKAEKRDLLQEEEKQRKQLDSERNEQNSKIKTFSSIESKLLSAINTKKKDALKLNKKIESIIAEEIRKERLRALEAANESGTNTGSRGSSVPTLTPKMRLLSSQFSENRGRLPWPVERGTIIGVFGKRVHPVLRDPPVYIQSNGIDISTVKGSAVLALFDGEVVNIIYSPSFQSGVIVKHGEYFTVYTNLINVSVKPGDAVKAKMPLGTAYTDDSENKTEVHLEVWKGTTLMNPEEWIIR